MHKIWLFVALILFSCNRNEKVKVAFLFSHLKADRYVKEKAYFSEKVNELGGEAIIVSADYDQELQIKQASEFLKEGIKVLVLNAVNVNLAALIVRDAHRYGAIVIAYDRLIRNADVDYYLSFKYDMVGQLMAQYVTKLKPTGNYILLGGDKTDFNAVQIKKGQMEFLKPYITDGKIKLLYDVFVEEWKPENAYYEIESCFRLNDTYPDVIISSSDRMSEGVIKALQKYNLAGKVLLTGQDADQMACKRILNNTQTMSVYKSFKKLAYTAAEVAMKYAKGEKIGEIKESFWNGSGQIPAILVDPVIVDKNNIKSTVIADGLYTESEIYNN